MSWWAVTGLASPTFSTPFNSSCPMSTRISGQNKDRHFFTRELVKNGQFDCKKSIILFYKMANVQLVSEKKYYVRLINFLFADS